MQMLFCVFLFVSRARNLLVKVFKVYVRPILEYNSVTWSPMLKKDIVCIEKVQRRFTKRLLAQEFNISVEIKPLEFNHLGTPTTTFRFNYVL